MTTPISLQTDTMLEWMPNVDDKELKIQAMMMQLRLQEEEKEVRQEAERRLQAAKQLEVTNRRYEQEMRQQAELRFQAEKQRLLKDKEEENQRLQEEKRRQEEEEQRQKLLSKRIEEQEETDRVALEAVWQRNKEATGKTLMRSEYVDLNNQMEKFYMWTIEGKKYYRNGFSHVFDRNDNGTVGKWRGCFFEERGFMHGPMPEKYMYGPSLNGPSWC